MEQRPKPMLSSPFSGVWIISQERGDSDTSVERKSGHRDTRDAERVLQQRLGDRCHSHSDHRVAVHLLFARASESSV